ncbi:hypothetical protein MPSEU_000319200 [Mayamaea pseudoterrestris]|nr:hypothetical protein MPSEU_000319200 [Mayamaea pseudoterrestris]
MPRRRQSNNYELLTSSSNRPRRGGAAAASSHEDTDDDDNSHVSGAAAPSANVAFACPHCSKTFKQEHGLNYHVSNFVCRAELKPKAASLTKQRKVPAKQQLESDDEDRDGESNDEQQAGDLDNESSSDEESHDENNRKRPARKTRARAVVRKRTKIVRTYREDETSDSISDNEAGDDDDDDEDRLNEKEVDGASNTDDADGDDASDSLPSTGKRRRAPAKVSSQINLPDDLKCPHCSKSFKVATGYLYHVNNFVCRQELRPGGPVRKGKRKASELASNDSSSKSDYRRIRGNLSSRTCPKCKRVFTSTLGCKYHVEKNVCTSTARKAASNANNIPLSTLQPGLLFVTKYGVVKVVADNRAVPTAVYSKDYKQESKKFSNARAQYEKRLQNLKLANTIQHLAKRAKLTELYTAREVTQESVFETSIGVKHPMIFKNSGDYPSAMVAPSRPPNPSEPEGSFPDRIVECVVIPDNRTRFHGDDDEDPIHVHPSGNVGCKMFLQRRLLNTPFNEHQSLFCCHHCGQEFASKPGAKYHLQSEVCIIKSRNAAESFKHTMESLVDSQMCTDSDEESGSVGHRTAKQALAFPKMRAFGSMLRDAPAPTRIFTRKKEKLITNVSVYPQVYMALGFRFLARSAVPVKQSTISAFKKRTKPRKTEQITDVDEDADDDVMATVVLSSDVPPVGARRPKSNLRKPTPEEAMNPRLVLADLEKQLMFEQAKQLGSIYECVFKSLKFKKEKVKRRKRGRKKEADSVRETSNVPAKTGYDEFLRVSKAKPAGSLKAIQAPHNHRLLSIDTGVLAVEVDAGRYPSMKRNKPDQEHHTSCYLCKYNAEVAPLMECQFCARSVHWECMLSRYIVQEPDTDFMCSECINYIHHRRKRAEKRKLEKLGLLEQAEEMSDPALLTSVVPGREYDCLLAQGHRVAELSELLEDTRRRLSQTLSVAQLDEMRFASIESAEREAQIVPMAWD